MTSLKVGWHAGNVEPIDDLDWRIMGIVPPRCFTYVSGEQIGGDQLRRVAQLAPDAEAVVRPYYHPQPYSVAGIDRYIDQCKHDLNEAMRGMPPDRLHLKAFNEPNQPRWGQWEGFGCQPDDLRRYNEAFLRVVSKIRPFAPDVRIQVLSLTDYRDVRCPGDPEDATYWVHGRDGTAATCLVKDAIESADEIGCHVYIHRREGQPANATETNINSIYYGLRFWQIHQFWPNKPIYITEAGYPNPAHWPQDAGVKVAQWLRLLTEYPYVEGVSLWMLGEGQGHNGHWRDGSAPAAQVYDVARWQTAGPPITQPIDLSEEYLQLARLHKIRINPGAALKAAIEGAGQWVGGNEFDAGPDKARQWGYASREDRWYLWQWDAATGCRAIYSEDAVRA